MEVYTILFYAFFALVVKFVYDNFGSKRKISNRTVVITGSGQGIGRELCKKFAEEHCHVACVDVNQTQNKITVNEAHKLNGSVVIKDYVCDVSNYQQVQELAQKIHQDFGPVDILINNAGIVDTGLITDFSADQIKRTIDVNLMAHFWTTKSFLPKMLEQNSGVIVAISSILGVIPSPYVMPYCTSKFAVFGFMESLRLELLTLKSKIKCLTVCPSVINTQMTNFINKKPFFLEITEPQVLAQSIIDAIKREKTMVYVPWYTSFAGIGKMLLPDFIFDRCLSLLSINNLIKH